MSAVSGASASPDDLTVPSHDPFASILGDRRGSDREDPPPDPCWWRVLAFDPRCRRLVEFLDQRFAEGRRFAVIDPSELLGPWRLCTYRDDGCDFEWGAQDIGLLDYERDRLVELWPGAKALEGESADGDAYGGWLIPSPSLGDASPQLRS